MDQRIINLFDEYTHAPLSREVFMKKLAKLAGGTAAAMAILPLLEGGYAHAMVPENDNDLDIMEVSFPGKDCTVKGYLAMPKNLSGKTGGVMVIHENRGLTGHIKDVTRRVAKAGYLSLGIDALSPLGGTPENEDEARGLFGKLDVEQTRQNLLAGLVYLRNHEKSNGKTGTVGFCWGGGFANQMAVHDPLLNAAVPYYGRQPDTEDVAKIKAKMLIQYGGLDTRINEGIPAFEAALKESKVDYQLFVYEGAQHAFNNDTSEARYNPEVAKLAWERTLNLFKETLS